MGGNASWRRRTLEEFGLWDECTPIEDEPSLCYRVHAGKQPGDHMVFDPVTTMIRRLGVAGGMDKRALSPAGYGAKLFTFFHNVIAHYFPVRFALLYPLYVGFLAFQVYDWLLDDARGRTPTGKVLAGAGFTLASVCGDNGSDAGGCDGSATASASTARRSRPTDPDRLAAESEVRAGYLPAA